jgi:polyphosphate kinase
MRRGAATAAAVASVAAAWLGAGPASAHPHEFIDAGIEVRFDAEGRVEALRIIWVYDEFVSLIILEERGLDPDGDGVLTAEERATLQGFDMNWDEGFAGDTYALSGGGPLALGRPEQFTADVVAGRLVSTHLRRLEQPVAAADVPFVVQIYDPDYYTAYTIATDPVLSGRADCTAQVWGPDIDAAQAELAAAMKELGADAETEFPAVGAAFAEEVRVTCPGS